MAFNLVSCRMRFTHRFSIKGNLSNSTVFRWLAAGSGLNSAGMQGEQVILGLLVYQLTQSSAWVGISLALFFAPMLLVGVPAGALADRFDRRTVLIRTELALVVSLAVFAMLLFNGAAGLYAALAMSVLSGVLRSLHHPARLSYTGDIAGNSGMVAALSLLSVVTRFGQLLGAVVAGVISEHYGPGSAYAALALGHALAFWCFLRTHSNRTSTDTPRADKPQTVNRAIVEYLSLLKSSRILVLLIIFASLIEVFGFSFATALPQIAVERLALDAGGLGLMHAARAAGGLCGALLLTVLVVRNLGILYLAIMLGFGLALMLLAIAPQVTTVLLCIAIIAVFSSTSDILAQGMLQLCVPDALRGRAMGAWVVALGMGPIGHLELGFLISAVGTTAALLTNGAALLLIGTLALLYSPALRSIRNAA